MKHIEKDVFYWQNDKQDLKLEWGLYEYDQHIIIFMDSEVQVLKKSGVIIFELFELIEVFLYLKTKQTLLNFM
jgi:hypothetical protein